MRGSDLVRGLLDLSKLGRLQVVILMLNVLGPFLAINSEASFSDPLYLLLGFEFIVFAVLGILYTIAVENEYAFYSLIFMQLQLVGYVTASSAVGVMAKGNMWLRWGIVAWCWIALITFLVLQRAVRRRWGWHAWSLAGANVAHIELYRQYQMLSAAAVIDAFHAILFFTCQIFLRTDGWWEDALIGVLALMTVLATKPLQLSMRREKPVIVLVILIIYLLGFGGYVDFAVRNTVRLARGEVLPRRFVNAHTSPGEAIVIVAIEFSAVIVRIICVFAIANGTTIFGRGLSTFLPKESRQQHENTRYLIDPADHVNRASVFSVPTSSSAHQTPRAGYGGAERHHHHSRSSTGGLVLPASPHSHARFIDATNRTVSVAKPPSELLQQ